MIIGEQVYILEDVSRMTAEEVFMLPKKYDVLIVSYDALKSTHWTLHIFRMRLKAVARMANDPTPPPPPARRNIPLHSDLFTMFKWPIKRLILDEAHQINSRHDTRHYAAKDLDYEAVLVMTGAMAYYDWRRRNHLT